MADLPDVEALLHRCESDTLDFKQKQYPLAGANDHAKSEFIKDVLAFANAWKTSDAYIVVGVKDNHGERGIILGVDEHLDDATLQQLVNSKTSVPVAFDYIPTQADGKPIGIVRIAKEQRRPIYLKKTFGKLDAGAVYLRRGTSTAVAKPEDIYRMGAEGAQTASSPTLAVELGESTAETRLGPIAIVTSRVLLDKPSPLSPEEERELGRLMKRIRRPISLIEAQSRVLDDRPSRAALDAHRKECALLSAVSLVTDNTSQRLAEGVIADLKIPAVEDLIVLEELPEPPRGRFSISVLSALEPGMMPPRTRVRRVRDEWHVSVSLGNIRPGDSTWSDPFWIGCPTSVEITVTARVLGDNLPRPLEFMLPLSIRVREEFLEDEEDEDA